MLKNIFLVGALFLGQFAFAQQYKTAIGVRGDWSNLKNDLAQLSLKHFLNDRNALEVNLGFGERYVWSEFNHHINQPLNKELDWYLGYGMNLGYWNTNYDNRYDAAERSGFWWGFGGLLGLEFTTKVFPLNFALDAGPAVSLLPTPKVGVKMGFAARYAIR
jgi:hypothetical protein